MKDTTLRNITIVTNGTRGDVQPYIAIAMALRKKKYKIRFATNHDVCPWLESLGFESVDVFHSCRKDVQSNPEVLRVLGEGNAKDFFQFLRKQNQECGPDRLFRFVQEIKAHPPDLLIVGTLTEYYATYAWYVYNIPMIHCKTFPLILTNSRRATLGFPTLPFGLHYYLMKNIILKNQYKTWVQMDQDGANRLDKGTKLVTNYISEQDYMRESQEPSSPFLLFLPPLYKKILFDDGTNTSLLKNFRFVGSPMIPSQVQQTNTVGFGSQGDRLAISKFLETDPARKPVYCGWGSMICKSPQYMVEWIVRALQQSGQRGIVLAGWAELSLDLLSSTTDDDKLVKYAKQNVLFVKNVAHEWLLPQTACTIHHGGQGTLAAALRAGVPTIVTPIFVDQFDSAYLVNQTGVGIGFEKTRLQYISSTQLADAIGTVLQKDSTYKTKAKDIQTQLATQDGASNVALEIESFWNNIVITGKYKEMRSQILYKAGYDSNGNPLDDDKAEKETFTYNYGKNLLKSCARRLDVFILVMGCLGVLRFFLTVLTLYDTTSSTA